MLDMGVIDMIIRPTFNMLYVMDLMDTKVTSRKSQARPTRGEGDERGTSKYNGFKNAGWVIWQKRKDREGLVENLVNLAVDVAGRELGHLPREQRGSTIPENSKSAQRLSSAKTTRTPPM